MEVEASTFNTVELPPSIEIKESIVCKGSPGAFSKTLISENTRFGPYKGEIITPDQKPFLDYRYAWEVFEKNSDDLKFTISAADPQSSNWMRNVNCARFYEEQNILSMQDGYSIFYMAMKDIKPGEELLTWFDPKLLRRTQRRLSKLERKPVGYTIELVPMEDEKKFVPEIIQTKRARKKKVLSDMVSLEEEGSLLVRKNFNKIFKAEKEQERRSPLSDSKTKRELSSGSSVSPSVSESKVRKEKEVNQNFNSSELSKRHVKVLPDQVTDSGHKQSTSPATDAESESFAESAGRGRRRKVRKNLVGMKRRNPTKCRGRKPKILANGKVDLSKEITISDSSVKPVLIKRNEDGSISVDDHDESYRLENIELSTECDESCQCLDKEKAMDSQKSLSEKYGGAFVIHFVLLPEHKTETEDRQIAYKCDICDSAYRHVFSLKRHYLGVHINHRYLTNDDIVSCQIDTFYPGVQMPDAGTTDVSPNVSSSHNAPGASGDGPPADKDGNVQAAPLPLPLIANQLNTSSCVLGDRNAQSNEHFAKLKDSEKFLLCNETLGGEDDEDNTPRVHKLSHLAQTCINNHQSMTEKSCDDVEKKKSSSAFSLVCTESLTSAELLTPTTAELQSKPVSICAVSSQKHAAINSRATSNNNQLVSSSPQESRPESVETSSQHAVGTGLQQDKSQSSSLPADSLASDDVAYEENLSNSQVEKSDASSGEKISSEEVMSVDSVPECPKVETTEIPIISSLGVDKYDEFASSGQKQQRTEAISQENDGSPGTNGCGQSVDTREHKKETSSSRNIAPKLTVSQTSVDLPDSSPPIKSVNESCLSSSESEPSSQLVTSTTLHCDLAADTVHGGTQKQNVTDGKSTESLGSETSRDSKTLQEKAEISFQEESNKKVGEDSEDGKAVSARLSTSSNVVSDTVETCEEKSQKSSELTSVATHGSEASTPVLTKAEAESESVDGSKKESSEKLQSEAKVLEVSANGGSEPVSTEDSKSEEKTESSDSSKGENSEEQQTNASNTEMKADASEVSKSESPESSQADAPKIVSETLQVCKNDTTLVTSSATSSAPSGNPQQPVIFVTNIVFPIVSPSHKNLPMSLPLSVPPASAGVSSAPPTTVMSQGGLPVVLISSLSRGINVQNANALLQSPSTLRTLQSIQSTLTMASVGQSSSAAPNPNVAVNPALTSPLSSTSSTSSSVVAVTTNPIPSILNTNNNNNNSTAVRSPESTQGGQQQSAQTAHPSSQPSSDPASSVAAPSGSSLKSLLTLPDDLYRCHMCVLVFQTMEELKNHIKNDPHRFKGGVKQYSCLQCSMRFAFKNNLIRHNLMYHQNDKDLKHRCLTCGKGFTTETYLKMHARFHSGKNFPCKYGCVNLVFPNAASLVKHLRTAHAGLDRQEFLKNAKAERARRKKLSRLFGLSEDEISKLTPDAMSMNKPELHKWKASAIASMPPNTISTYSIDRPGIGFQAKRGRPKGSKNAPKLTKDPVIVPILPKPERLDIVVRSEEVKPAAVDEQGGVKRKPFIRFRCKVCHKGFTTHMRFLQHRTSRHGADQSVQEYLFEMSKGARDDDFTSDDCEDMSFSPPPSPKSFYANVNKKGSENVRKFIDGGAESLTMWRKHVQIQNYESWTKDVQYNSEQRLPEWTQFNFPPCFELKEDCVHFYEVGKGPGDIRFRGGLKGETICTPQLQVKQASQAESVGDGKAVVQIELPGKCNDVSQGDKSSVKTGPLLETDCQGVVDNICSTIEQGNKDIDGNASCSNTESENKCDEAAEQGGEVGSISMKTEKFQQDKPGNKSSGSDNQTNPGVQASGESCRAEPQEDLSMVKSKADVPASSEIKSTPAETDDSNWLENLACDSTSLSSAPDSGLGSLSSSASGSLSSYDALLSSTSLDRVLDQGGSEEATTTLETKPDEAGGTSRNLTQPKVNLALLRELKVKEIFQVMSSKPIQALNLELGTCATTPSRGQKSSCLSFEALNLCRKDDDSHKQRGVSIHDFRLVTQLSRRGRRGCTLSSSGLASPPPHKKLRRSFDQSPDLHLNTSDSVRHEHRRYSIWSGVSQHKSHSQSGGVHSCPVVERVKKQESMRQIRAFESGKSQRMAESKPKLSRREKDQMEFLEMSGLVRRRDFEISPQAKEKEQHCIKPPEVWDIYQKIWFGKRGTITVVCSICHRHFSCIELCLRHQLKKHPHIEPHSLEMERDNYVEDMFYYYPMPYGILAKSQLIPDNMPAPEIYVCTRCTFPFKNLTKLHAHMIVCDPAHQELTREQVQPKPSFMKGKLLPMMDRRLNQQSAPPRPKLGRPLKNKALPASVTRTKSDEGKSAPVHVQRSSSVVAMPTQREFQEQRSISRIKPARSQSALFFPVKKRKNYEMMYNPKKHVRRRELYQVLEQHQCHGCNLKFNSLPMLERHVRKCSGRDKLQSQKPLLSGIIPDDAAVRKQHTCRYCNKRFTYIKGVDLHYKRVCSVRKLKEEENQLTAEDLAHEDELQRIIEHMKWSKTLNKDSSDIIQGHVRVEEDGTLTRVVKKRGWPRGLKKKVKKKGFKWTTLKRHRSEEDLQEPQPEGRQLRRSSKDSSEISESPEVSKKVVDPPVRRGRGRPPLNRTAGKDTTTAKPDKVSVQSTSSDHKIAASSKGAEEKPVAKRGRPRKKVSPVKQEAVQSTVVTNKESPASKVTKPVREKSKKEVKDPVIPEVVKPPPRKRGRPKKFDPSDMESSYKKRRKPEASLMTSKIDAKPEKEAAAASQSEHGMKGGDSKNNATSVSPEDKDKGKKIGTGVVAKPIEGKGKQDANSKSEGDADSHEVFGMTGTRLGSGGSVAGSQSHSELFKHLTHPEEEVGRGKHLVTIESATRPLKENQKDTGSPTAKDKGKFSSAYSGMEKLSESLQRKKSPTMTAVDRILLKGKEFFAGPASPSKMKSISANDIRQKEMGSAGSNRDDNPPKSKLLPTPTSSTGKLLDRSVLPIVKKRPPSYFYDDGNSAKKRKEPPHTVPVFRSIPSFPSFSATKPSPSTHHSSGVKTKSPTSTPVSRAVAPPKATRGQEISPVKTLSAVATTSASSVVVSKPPVSVRVVTLSPNGNNLLTYDELPKVSAAPQTLTSPDKFISPSKILTPVLTTLPKSKAQTSGSSVIQSMSQLSHRVTVCQTPHVPARVTVGQAPQGPSVIKIPVSSVAAQQIIGSKPLSPNKPMKTAEGSSTFVTVSSSTKQFSHTQDQTGLHSLPTPVQEAMAESNEPATSRVKASPQAVTSQSVVTPAVSISVVDHNPVTVSRLAAPTVVSAMSTTGKFARGTIVPGVISNSSIQSGTRMVKVGNVLTTSPIGGQQQEVNMGPRPAVSRFIPAVVTPKPIIVSTTPPIRKVPPQTTRFQRAAGLPQTMSTMTKASVMPQSLAQRHLVYRQSQGQISVAAANAGVIPNRPRPAVHSYTLEEAPRVFGKPVPLQSATRPTFQPVPVAQGKQLSVAGNPAQAHAPSGSTSSVLTIVPPGSGAQNLVPLSAGTNPTTPAAAAPARASLPAKKIMFSLEDGTTGVLDPDSLVQFLSMAPSLSRSNLEAVNQGAVVAGSVPPTGVVQQSGEVTWPQQGTVDLTDLPDSTCDL